MKAIVTAAALAAALLLPAHAAPITVQGVDVPEQIQTQGEELVRYGAGVRSKFFMKLYVGSLFSQKPGQDAEAILNSEAISAVRLNIISSMITSDRMIETIEEGFDAASGGKVAPLRERLDTFLSLFDEPVEVDDQFTMVSIPGVGVEAYKNGELLTLIEGDDFRRTLFGIWLGDQPADKKLKKAMLGQ
ncbi:chalcone isomerase family protein [Ferrimonas gelatinilytica]|uniref:Chalcone isomerase family protein n=1 Tax=Ferrimonas gelatinilytica TaxID=1255257 RepID=A0ABP9S0B4_9GAMM